MTWKAAGLALELAALLLAIASQDAVSQVVFSLVILGTILEDIGGARRESR